MIMIMMLLLHAYGRVVLETVEADTSLEANCRLEGLCCLFIHYVSLYSKVSTL